MWGQGRLGVHVARFTRELRTLFNSKGVLSKVRLEHKGVWLKCHLSSSWSTFLMENRLRTLLCGLLYLCKRSKDRSCPTICAVLPGVLMLSFSKWQRLPPPLILCVIFYYYFSSSQKISTFFFLHISTHGLKATGCLEIEVWESCHLQSLSLVPEQPLRPAEAFGSVTTEILTRPRARAHQVLGGP